MNLLKQIVADNEKCYQSGKYPIDATDNKIHVLYLGFYLNGTGIYRALLPALELNKTTTHAAIVHQLHPFGQPGQIDEVRLNIHDDLIQWADHIVFATSFHKLSDMIKLLKQVNPKPHLKFYMDIDDNYHTDMPGQNNQHIEKHREKLIDNMRACHNVICENKNLKNWYHELLNNAIISPFYGTVQLHIMPNLLSDDCYTGLEIIPRASEKFRIGMIFNSTQWSDVYPIRKTLIEINKKYKDSVELIVFGWNGQIHGKGTHADLFKVIRYQWVKPVEITDYFETLANLHLDIALMPLLDNEFNRCKSYHKLLQYSQAGIIAICSPVEPYINVIKPIYTSPTIHLSHFLINDTLINEIEDLMTIGEDSKLMISNNKKIVSKNYTWHTNHKILTDLFA